MNEEQHAKIMSDLARNEQEHASYNRRLQEHDEALKKQNDILIVLERQGNNIERLTGSMSRIEKSMEKVDKRLDEIEREPADKWKKISFEIIKYVVLAIVAVAVGVLIGGNG